MSENRLCKNCRNFLELPNSGDHPEMAGHGLCRANPPSVFVMKDPNTGEERINSHFPIMPVSGWCGQFIVGKGPGISSPEVKSVPVVN